MKRIYQLPVTQTFRLEHESMVASTGGPSADFMHDPTISNAKASHSSDVQNYSVWDDNWEE